MRPYFAISSDFLNSPETSVTDPLLSNSVHLSFRSAPEGFLESARARLKSWAEGSSYELPMGRSYLYSFLLFDAAFLSRLFRSRWKRPRLRDDFVEACLIPEDVVVTRCKLWS